MTAVKTGDRVAVMYEGRFEDGTVFDSSTHGDHSHPLIFVVGEHQVIPGFEQSVIGLVEGEKKEISIAPQDGYGDRDERLLQKIPRSELTLPRNQQPHVGMALVTRTPDGNTIQLFIKEVSEESVTLDLNHPLAGKTLLFTITVVGINTTIKPEHEHAH